MAATREIRADFDRDSIVVYQAYGRAIAEPALRTGRFVAPFSFQRMTWIKPSFLWLMHRSNWGQKKGQENILRVRLRRSGWDQALGEAVLTSPDGPVFGRSDRWEREFPSAPVHVQWDTERSLRGAALEHLSIQVGISRHRIRALVDEWIVAIEDLTPSVVKMRTLLKQGRAADAKRLLPPEREYPVPADVAERLWMG